MYYRPRFLEELHAIREEMSRECDYDMDRFAASLSSSQNPSDEANNQHPTVILSDTEQNNSHSSPKRKTKRNKPQ